MGDRAAVSHLGAGAPNPPLTHSVLSFSRVNATYNNAFNGTFDYLSDHVCYRPGGPTSPCQVASVLDFWNYSASAIQADTDLSATVSNTSAVDRLGRPLPPQTVMDFTRDPVSGLITTVSAYQLFFSLQNNKKGPGSSERDAITDTWQKTAVPVIRGVRGQKANRAEGQKEVILMPSSLCCWVDTACSTRAATSSRGFCRNGPPTTWRPLPSLTISPKSLLGTSFSSFRTLFHRNLTSSQESEL